MLDGVVDVMGGIAVSFPPFFIYYMYFFLMRNEGVWGGNENSSIDGDSGQIILRGGELGEVLWVSSGVCVRVGDERRLV